MKESRFQVLDEVRIVRAIYSCGSGARDLTESEIETYVLLLDSISTITDVNIGEYIVYETSNGEAFYEEELDWI